MISNEYWHCSQPGYWLAHSVCLQTLIHTKQEEFLSPTSKFILMPRMTVTLKEKRKTKQVNKYRNNKSIIFIVSSLLCSWPAVDSSWKHQNNLKLDFAKSLFRSLLWPKVETDVTCDCMTVICECHWCYGWLPTAVISPGFLYVTVTQRYFILPFIV